MNSALILVGCLVLYISSGVLGLSEPTQLRDTEIKERDSDGPTDVTSVSKFIKEFHRQIDDIELYRTLVHSENEEATVEEYVTAANTSQGVNATSLINCIITRKAGFLTVELVNSTRLANLLKIDPNITNKTEKADCLVLLFYARTCPFSCMTAPHFNALPRAFPTIKMAAVNALQHSSFNTQYGIVGVPTVMLFHNGRPAAKFNESEYTLEKFTKFISRYTGILPEEKMFVTSADFGGPVGSVVAKETDYWLGLAWLVIAVVGGMGVAKSRMWHSLVEAVQNSWRDAEAQHFHAD